MSVNDLQEKFLERSYSSGIQIAQNLLATDPNNLWVNRMLGLCLLFVEYEKGIQQLSFASHIGDKYSRMALMAIEDLRIENSKSVNWNLLEFSIDFRFKKDSRYMDYPLEVTLETQAVCNAACTFCPYPTMERKGEKMEIDLIYKIIDDLAEIPADLPFSISPFKMSDPFVDRRIFDISKRINLILPNARLRFFTNGAPLTDKNIDKLGSIENVSDLWISLNESDAVRYKKLMGIPFERTIERLDELHRVVESGYPHPVTVSRVEDGTIYDHMFMEYVAERYPLFRAQISKVSNWLGQVELDVLSETPSLGCMRWFELNIMASGKVALCCMDGIGDYVIGDLNTCSALEVYNSAGYKKMRQYSISRKGASSPCDTCNL